MSFFSRRKQQPAPPPANVPTQTPSQALAQVSNSNRDLAQPGSLRGDSPLTQYVKKHTINSFNSHIYLSGLQVALGPYLNSNRNPNRNRSPYDLKVEITLRILAYSPRIPPNPSNNHPSSSSNNSRLVTKPLFPGPLVDLYSFQASLVNLVSHLSLHLLLPPSLDTGMLYQQAPVPMENSIFSVVWSGNQRGMMSTSSQRGITLPLSYRLRDQSQVRGWAMQVLLLGMR